MAYSRVNWQSGTKVSDGYVEINGTRHTTVQPQYSGNTPINPTSLNIMDAGIAENSNMLNGISPISNIFVGNIQSKNYWKLEDELRVTRRTSFTNNIPAGTYTISGYITGDDAVSSLINFYDSNENLLTSVLLEHNIRNISSIFQLSSECTLVRVYSNNTDSASQNKTSVFENMQIEKGTSATEYVKHTDFGFESGSNDNGKWIKYEDGTMICWGYRSFSNLSIQKAWGALYETASEYNLGDFPQTFIDTPELFTNTRNGSTIFTERLLPTRSSLGSTWFYCPVSRSNESFIMSYLAIGRWK